MKAYNPMKISQLSLTALCIALLSGCVTTDDLYADYQCKNCELRAPVVAAFATSTVSAPSLTWEQAVYFGYDLATLDEIETQRLDTNLKVMAKYPTNKVVVTGNTDSDADYDYNDRLSQRRVTTVRDYLIDKGLAPERIIAIAAGELSALFPENKTVVERATNRRVTMLLVDAERRPAALDLADVLAPDKPLKMPSPKVSAE